MIPKYELIDDPNRPGFKRVRALRDFGDVTSGELGGWIESESNLSQDGDAWVYGAARVSGDARVYGDAQVSGNALAQCSSLVYGSSRVSGDAFVFGNENRIHRR